MFVLECVSTVILSHIIELFAPINSPLMHLKRICYNKEDDNDGDENIMREMTLLCEV